MQLQVEMAMEYGIWEIWNREWSPAHRNMASFEEIRIRIRIE